MSTINFKIDYNSVKTTNPEMGSEALARKSRYILENKLVFDDPVILRVGLYARLSVEDGDNEISDSIATQLAIGAGFFALNPELIHVKTYIDDGYSGLDFDRPDFQNMMDDLKTGLINCVVVKDVSRAGRNYKALGTFLSETIRDMGVRFFSILDEYDSAEDEDGLPKLSVILQTVLDQKFSEDISKKVSSSIRAKTELGEFLPAAGSIPYGFLRDAVNVTYKVDEETAPVVLKIYSMRSERASISAVTNYLNDEGVPSPGKLRYLRGMSSDEKLKDSKWSRSTVRKILTDITYIGHRVHGRKQKETFHLPKKATDSDKWIIIENAHPAIVPPDLFYVVQGVNEEENNKQANQGKRQDVDIDYREIFKDEIFCADCGEPMIGKKNTARANSQSASFIYYECSRYLNSDRRNCKSHYIKGEAIASEITAQLLSFAETVLSKDFTKNVIEPLKIELVVIRKQVLDTRAQASKAQDAFAENFENYIDGKISKEQFSQNAIPIRENMKRLEKEEREQRQVMDAMDAKMDLYKEWIKLLREFQKTAELSGKIMDAFVEKVVIATGQHIFVEYSFNDFKSKAF